MTAPYGHGLSHVLLNYTCYFRREISGIQNTVFFALKNCPILIIFLGDGRCQTQAGTIVGVRP